MEERAGIMGKITSEIPVFKILCQLDRANGFLYELIGKIEELDKLEPDEALRQIILLDGRTQFVEKCDILTRLSGIQGDIREKGSVKELRGDLNKRLYGTTPDTH